jgi:nitroreductase
MAQSVTLAAASLGLGACIVSLYPEENSRRAAELVDADEGWTVRHAIALGHPAPAPRLGASAIPTGRLPLGELLRIRR